MKTLRGVYTAIITPFLEDGSLDTEGLKHNIRYQIANGIDGIVALGTTGECPTLSSEEKEMAIIAAKEACGQSPLIVGTGSNCTAHTIEASQKAEALGADAIMIVTPYYNRPSQKGIYEHFAAVARAVSLPIIIYNIPKRAGQNIATDTIVRLSEIENIVCVKEASGDIAQIADVIERTCRTDPDFTVLCGDDSLTLPTLSLGGHGVISVISNLLPKEMKGLVEAAQFGDYDKAREIHYHLKPLLSALSADTNPMPIKAAMRQCGMPAGGCRLPLCSLDPQVETKIHEELEKLCNDLLMAAVS